MLIDFLKGTASSVELPNGQTITPVLNPEITCRSTPNRAPLTPAAASSVGGQKPVKPVVKPKLSHVDKNQGGSLVIPTGFAEPETEIPPTSELENTPNLNGGSTEDIDVDGGSETAQPAQSGEGPSTETTVESDTATTEQQLEKENPQNTPQLVNGENISETNPPTSLRDPEDKNLTFASIINELIAAAPKTEPQDTLAPPPRGGITIPTLFEQTHNSPSKEQPPAPDSDSDDSPPKEPFTDKAVALFQKHCWSTKLRKIVTAGTAALVLLTFLSMLNKKPTTTPHYATEPAAPVTAPTATTPHDMRPTVLQPQIAESPHCPENPDGGIADANNLITSDRSVAWVCARAWGLDGQSIHVVFPNPVVLTQVIVTPGYDYVTPSSGEDNWLEHRVPTYIVWHINNSTYYQTLAVKRGPQTYKFNKITVSELMLTINRSSRPAGDHVKTRSKAQQAAVAGPEVDKTVAISKIVFYGYPL